MQLSRPSRRATAVALAGVLWIAGAPDHRAAPATDPAPPLSPLSAPQERRAAALARYATAVSLELRFGLPEALPEYEAALDLDPQNVALAVRLAQAAMSRKQYDAARQRLETALKHSPTAPDPWFWLGIIHRGQDRPAQALDAYRRALKLDPQHLSSLRGLAELQLKESPAEVATLLDKAGQSDSSDANYWLGLGDLIAATLKDQPRLADQLPPQRIRAAYEKAGALAPRNADVWLRLADIYLEAGDHAAATKALQQLLFLRADVPRLHERLAYTYLQAEQKEPAIATLKEIIKRDPLRFEIYNWLAEVYDSMDNRKEAIAQYQQSLVLNPNQLEVYTRLTVLLLGDKQLDEALQLLAVAQARFPTRYHVPYLRGIVHSEQKEYVKAMTAFADAEKLGVEADEELPPNSAFYFSYGAACERAGEFEKAVALFRKSLELDPDNHAAANYLGYMWADKNENLEEAHKLIAKAVAGAPDNGAYVDSLGWVLYRLGRTEEALPYLRRAAELVKDDSVVLEHLAEVLLKLGRRDEALQHLKAAVAMDPDNKALATKLRDLQAATP